MRQFRSITLLAAAVVSLAGLPAVAQNAPAPHPATVLKTFFPGASPFAQRLDRTFNSNRTQTILAALEDSYGPADSGRGDTLVWTIPLQNPVVGQADKAEVMVEPTTKGRYHVVIEDRAPRGADRSRPPRPTPRVATDTRPVQPITSE